MGRHMIALLLAVLLTAGAVTAAAISLSADQEQVTYQENRLAGDPAAAEGLEVFARHNYGQQAYWFTRHTHTQQPEAETEFRFYAASKSLFEGEIAYSGVNMGILGDYQFESLDSLYRLMLQRGISEFTGLMEAYRQLDAATEEGELTNTYIRIADYCRYYPLYGWMDTPAGGNHWNSSVSGGYLEAGEAIAETFNNYFRIPVLEDHWMQVVVDKRRGSVMSSVDVTEHYRGEDFFRMNTVGTCYGDTAYFTFDPLTEKGNTVDTSLIPGGYGLYAFRYSKETGNGFESDSLTTLRPLDPTHRPVQILVDGKRGTLELYTHKDQDTYLTVIDLQTMETLQQLRILGYSEDSWQFYHREDTFLLGISGEDSIDIWQKKPDGTYTFAFRAPLDPQTQLESIDLYDAAYAFDGQRLAVVDVIRQEREYFGYYAYPSGYSLSVYTPEGLAYCGTFTASLNVPAILTAGSVDHPYTEALTALWREKTQ